MNGAMYSIQWNIQHLDNKDIKQNFVKFMFCGMYRKSGVRMLRLNNTVKQFITYLSQYKDSLVIKCMKYQKDYVNMNIVKYFYQHYKEQPVKNIKAELVT